MKKNAKVLLFLILTFVLSSCQFPGFGTKAAGCGPSTLKIGDKSYQIKTIKAKKDGNLNIPANKPDTAFWVDGTNINQVFALSSYRKKPCSFILSEKRRRNFGHMGKL